jgi:hypothetical protein
MPPPSLHVWHRLQTAALSAGVTYVLRVSGVFDDGAPVPVSTSVAFVLDRSPPTVASVLLRPASTPQAGAGSSVPLSPKLALEVCVADLFDGDTYITSAEVCIGAGMGVCTVPVALGNASGNGTVPPPASFCSTVSVGSLLANATNCTSVLATLFAADAVGRTLTAVSNFLVLQLDTALIGGVVLGVPQGVTNATTGQVYMGPQDAFEVGWSVPWTPCAPLLGFEYEVLAGAQVLVPRTTVGPGVFGVAVPPEGSSVPHLAPVQARVRAITTSGVPTSWTASPEVLFCSQAPNVTAVSVTSVSARGIVSGAAASVSWNVTGWGCPMLNVTVSVARSGTVIPTGFSVTQGVAVSTVIIPGSAFMDGNVLVAAVSVSSALGGLVSSEAMSPPFTFDSTPPTIQSPVAETSSALAAFRLPSASFAADVPQAALYGLLDAASAATPAVRAMSQLGANWQRSFSDLESGIAQYSVCVGYLAVPDSCDVVPLTPVGQSGSLATALAGLVFGDVSSQRGPVTVRVTATNNAGLPSATSAQGAGVWYYPDPTLMATSATVTTCPECLEQDRYELPDPTLRSFMLPAGVDGRVQVTLDFQNSFTYLRADQTGAGAEGPLADNSTSASSPYVEVPGQSRVAAFLPISVAQTTYAAFRANLSMSMLDVLTAASTQVLGVVPGSALQNTTVLVPRYSPDPVVVGVVAIDIAGFTTVTWGAQFVSFGRWL